jgi:DNA-directed RNA polymerase subunit beta
MELIKKTVEVKDALNWHLTRNACRTWTEDFVDEDTGKSALIERSEVVCKKGAVINELTQSLLAQNGVTEVEVSNVPLLGEQEKYLSLWETVLKIRYKDGKPCKRSYFVTAECPAGAEAFISDHFVLNIEAVFELVKVNTLDYNKVIKMYETEREEYEADGKKQAHWYKCQIYSMVDDDGDGKNAGMKNILVQAVSFEKAIVAIKTVMTRDEYDAMYNTMKLLQELSVVDVFIPDESVSYYSDNDISSVIQLEGVRECYRQTEKISEAIKKL